MIMIKDYPFTPVSDEIARPILWIRVINRDANRSVITPAIIDTGADECGFPASIANGLGYKLKSVPLKTIVTANGKTVAYPHPAKVDILAMDSTGQPTYDVVHTIDEIPIDFIEGLEGFLLGTRNFLSDFILTIDYPQQIFSIRKPKKKN